MWCRSYNHRNPGSLLFFMEKGLRLAYNMRIKFPAGKQKEFLLKVLEAIGCPSLRELINRGIDARYSSLKNYYCERRLLPDSIFDELLKISKFNREDFDFESVRDNWGQAKGGKISRRK